MLRPAGCFVYGTCGFNGHFKFNVSKRLPGDRKNSGFKDISRYFILYRTYKKVTKTERSIGSQANVNQ